MLDFGLWHSVTGSSTVAMHPAHGFYVNGQNTGIQRENAWDAVFGRYYDQFQAQIFKDMEFNPALNHV